MDKHQSNAEQDAVFVRNFVIVLLFLTGIGVVVYFLANSVNSDFEASQRDDAAIAARVAPVGQLNTSGEPLTVASTAAAPAAAAGDAAVPAVASSPGEGAPAAPATAVPAAEPASAADAPAAEAPAVADTGAKGKEIYDGVCFVCHTPGAAGAPKVGDAANWGPRVAQGNDVLYDHAINGYMGQAGMMPPKGGRPDISDDDVKAAVDYMVNNSK